MEFPVGAGQTGSTQFPDMEKICRLCLAKDQNTVNIFGDEQETNISLRIMACTSLEVHASDTLPKQICQDCRIQLERSYYFRKRSQLSSNKLKKHIRLISAGKPSRVFEDIEDDPDNEDYEEVRYSLNFLMEIENDEREKQLQRDNELADVIRQRLREEEIDRLFEEAKDFFVRKGSVKANKPETSPEKDKAVASTSRTIHLKTDDEQQSNPVFEDVVDSTELNYDSSSKDDSQNEDDCYVVNNETEFDIEEDGSAYVTETEADTFTVVKMEKMNLQSMNFETEIISNDEQIQQDQDVYNVEQVSMIDENSISSNIQVFVSGNSDCEGDTQQGNRISIRFIDSNSCDAVVIPDEDGNSMEQDNEIKSIDYPDNKNEATAKTNQINYSDLIDVNNPNLDELKIFKCTLCPQAFTRRAQLIRHAPVHEKSRGYQCDHCEKWFACKSSLTRHVRIHTGEKPFKCNHCSRSFIQKEILKRHMATHTGERPFQCPHCKKCFVQRQILTAHINLKHTDNPVIQMHECSLCPKAFCHASGLSRHLLTHSGVQYTCKICDKKFSDKSAVKRHTSTVH